MSRSETSALWSRLAAAGLTAGGMPEPEESHTPWYVRVMLGIAGVIAAGFLLGFIGLAFEFVMESRTASVAAGLMLIAAAYGIFRAAPRNDFTAMFALAVSFAGQTLVAFGVLRIFDRGFGGSASFAVLAAIEALLAIVMPNFIHRVASAYAAGIAFSYACQAAGMYYVPPGVVAAAAAAVWLNEARLARRHSVVAPVGYGLTLSFMQIESAMLFGPQLGMLFDGRGAPPAWPWVGEALVAAALVVSTWVLLRRAGWAAGSSRTLFALAGVLAIGLASFKAPGIAGGLMIVLLGFANGNRVLAGLGVAALLFYVSSYYYLLDATLLAKAGVLAATGGVLLGVRWLVLNVVMPQERADA